MAHIIEGSNHLQEAYLAQKKRLWIFLGSSGGCLLVWLLYIFIAPRPDIWVVLGLLGLFGGLLYLTKYTYSQVCILAAGVKGEALALDAMKSLDNEHWIFTEKTVTYDDQESEIDFIVIGPEGVAVVECKHLKGSISGDYKEKYWQQEKLSHSGTVRTKRLYSPVKQVSTHVYRLAGLLKENGLNTQIDSVVYFSHPEAKLKLSGKEGATPVFYGSSADEALLGYLSKRRTPLAPFEVLAIAEAIHNQKAE